MRININCRCFNDNGFCNHYKRREKFLFFFTRKSECMELDGKSGCKDALRYERPKYVPPPSPPTTKRILKINIC